MSERGRQCQEGTTSGLYLTNRLEEAFIAGWNAGFQIPAAAVRPVKTKV